MTFKKFLSLLIIGVVLLLGLVFLLRLGQRNISTNLPSMDEPLPPLIPRTVEIPDEIRQKYAKIPEKNPSQSLSLSTVVLLTLSHFPQ